MITFTATTRLSAQIFARRRRHRLNRRSAKVENSSSYRKNKFYMRKCCKDTMKKRTVDDAVAVDKVTCEILSRLPVRSLTRFKCVCKSWRLLVEKEPYFINLHLSYSRSRLNFFCVVQKPLEGGFRHKSSRKVFFVTADYLPLDEGKDNIAVNIYNTREIDVPYCASFFGPLNGIVGFYDSRCYSGVRISNVCTKETTPWIESALVRKYKVEYKSFASNANCQLGFDPATKKHKVVCLCNIGYSNHRYGILCEVLTIGDNKWRICEISSNVFDDFKPIRGSVYVNGSIYFSTVTLHQGDEDDHDDGKIVVFDVGLENFRSITIPDFNVDRPRVYTGLAAYDVDLLEVGDHLALFRRINNYMVKLWLYDDVDDDDCKRKNAWTEISIELPYVWDSHRELTFHSVVGKEEIILKSYEHFVNIWRKDHSYHLYNWRKKTCTQIAISGIPSSIPNFFDASICDKTFVESFLSVQ